MIKTFQFLNFFDWYENKTTNLTIGEYYVVFSKETCGNNRFIYSCMLVCDYIPSNKSSNRLFSSSARFDTMSDSLEDLKLWYELSTNTINQIFANQIGMQYLSDYNEIIIPKIINNPYASGLCDRCINCIKDFCEIQNKNIEKVFVCNKFIQD